MFFLVQANIIGF